MARRTVQAARFETLLIPSTDRSDHPVDMPGSCTLLFSLDRLLLFFFILGQGNELVGIVTVTGVGRLLRFLSGACPVSIILCFENLCCLNYYHY